MEFSLIKPGAASKQAKAIYREAFPSEERIPYAVLVLKSLLGGHCEFWGLFDGDRLLAFAYVLFDDETAYIFYLAVARESRSQGLGAAMLSFVREHYAPRRLCLDIEPIEPAAPNLEQRERRKAFYLRNGFVDTDLDLIQGKYTYELLNCGEDFGEEALLRLLQKKFLGAKSMKIVPRGSSQ